MGPYSPEHNDDYIEATRFLFVFVMGIPMKKSKHVFSMGIPMKQINACILHGDPHETNQSMYFSWGPHAKIYFSWGSHENTCFEFFH